jgi:hypothetical protein
MMGKETGLLLPLNKWKEKIRDEENYYNKQA